MENKAHAFWAGVFTLGLMAVIIATLFWLNHDTAPREPFRIVTRQSVSGLARGALVRYRGVNVGRVGSIEFDPKVPGQIVIEIGVEPATPMTASTFATLAYQGVTGMAFVQLDDSGADPTPLRSSDEHMAQLPLHAGLINQLQQRGEALLDQVEQVTKELHSMLDDNTKQQLLATAKSLQQAASGVAALTQAAQPALQRMPATLEQLDRTLGATQQLAASLNRPNGPLMTNLDRVGIAADRASTALMGLNGTMTAMAARLAYDTLPRVDAMSDDARSAARAIDRAADTISGNPRSLLFGAPAPAPGPGEPGFAWSGNGSAGPAAAAK